MDLHIDIEPHASVCLATAFALIFFAVPRWGEKTMLVYVIICSLFGGLSVSCIQGLGAAILTTYVPFCCTLRVLEGLTVF